MPRGCVAVGRPARDTPEGKKCGKRRSRSETAIRNGRKLSAPCFKQKTRHSREAMRTRRSNMRDETVIGLDLGREERT
eukprot:4873416-Pyramimonas_sp.AAC.1